MLYRSIVLANAAFALALELTGNAAATTINTYKDWDGERTVSPFGCPNTTTYGQVITIPQGVTTLNKFTFWWKRLGNDGSMIVRGEVYAWDGTKAAGSALYESKRRKISFKDFDFHPVTFNVGAVPVTAGAQYVLFASIDKDFENCTSNYGVAFAASPARSYRAGYFVSQDNGGDESRWTTEEYAMWKTECDLGFKANLSP